MENVLFFFAKIQSILQNNNIKVIFILLQNFKTMLISSCELKVKKSAWSGGGVRTIKFVEGLPTNQEVLTASGKNLTITVGPGLPANTSEYSTYSELY